jgi:hypothetical protein
LGKLGIRRHPGQTLHHVEPTEPRVRGDVATPQEDGAILVGVEGPPADGRQRRSQGRQRFAQSSQVLRFRRGNKIQDFGAAEEPVRPDRHAPDHDEADSVFMQRLQQGMKVELAQRAETAPLMALICLQSACIRASRSLMLNASAASRRAIRACSKSPMSPSFPAVRGWLNTWRP